MKTLILSVCLCASALAAGAPAPVKLDRLLLSGHEYTTVTLAKKDANHALLIHATGVATILLADLPADLRQRLGYDPEAAKQAAEAAARAEAMARGKAEAEADKLKSSGLAGTKPISIHLWVSDNREDGLVVGRFSIHHSFLTDSLGSFGGGKSYSFEEEYPDSRLGYWYIKHSPQTKAMVVKSDFYATIQELSEPHRIDGYTVIKAYHIMSLDNAPVKNKK